MRSSKVRQDTALLLLQRCHYRHHAGHKARSRFTLGPKAVPLNLSLRHEVARLIVWHAVSIRPVVPSTVSYEEVREGNDPYRALGHGTHSFPTGT
jgi:hypothetical protein